MLHSPVRNAHMISRVTIHSNPRGTQYWEVKSKHLVFASMLLCMNQISGAQDEVARATSVASQRYGAQLTHVPTTKSWKLTATKKPFRNI